MKLKSGCFLQHLHLDEVMCLLSAGNAAVLADYFQLLDVHRKNYLNNLQFYCFVHYVTDLNKDQLLLLFDLLDQNTRGRICFNEFYTVNHLEKQFIHRHTGPTFQLLDIDRDNGIDFNEFEVTRFFFSIQKEELKKIFKYFDISGDEKDYKCCTLAYACAMEMLMPGSWVIVFTDNSPPLRSSILSNYLLQAVVASLR
ncbi:LOW QUALITY PROTEIN: EF-hand calcium-binding domain-containing protein 9 [Athene cunicularia]|uniref:LOW QUALITY PROTEIN: EF-hand calcium-binding domain-containing protein 9 n=1 Tax=Athene cunicularia TaxID=194338 RepID=UPI000EF6A03C|nr:LOW QUALITY PROTEIN: EF-hand calcium-binding domain-containing protein 9 [Athene cunicularia]